MEKKIALITDIHGNKYALESVLEDIKRQNVDEIICLGDTISIGPYSKECIDMLIDNNIKSVLGNHELYLLKGTDIEPSIEGAEKEHYKWIKDNLTDKEINYIKNCPLYYEINISYDDPKFNKKFILCHYLINNEKDKQPFEKNHLKNDVKLFIKYFNNSITYFIGHLHRKFNYNDVDGISWGYIEEICQLPNIEIVESVGCSYDNNASYTTIEIGKTMKYRNIKVEYDRESFINDIKNIEFPDKKNILKYFYGVDLDN